MPIVLEKESEHYIATLNDQNHVTQSTCIVCLNFGLVGIHLSAALEKLYYLLNYLLRVDCWFYLKIYIYSFFLRFFFFGFRGEGLRTKK